MNNNDIDFKQLWNQQEPAIPDTKELFEKMKKFNQNALRKLIKTNVLLILTSAFIIFVWYHYQPQMISTKLGIIMVILAMVLYLFVYNQTIPLLTKLDYKKPVNEYLRQLLKLKEKQLFLHSTMLNIYFILLLTGLCLYMYECTERMAAGWAIFSYIITLLWIGVNWFYFRPRIIKKQQAKMNALISKFETVRRQLDERR